MSKKRTLKEEFSLVLQGYKVLFKIDKRFIWIPIAKAALNAFLPFVNLFMSARILTELTGGRNLEKLIIYAVITVSLNFISAVLKKAVETKENIYLGQWWLKFNLFFNDVNNNMQYEHLENPQTHILRDKIYRTQHTVGGGFAALYWNIHGLVDGFFTVILSVSLAASMFTLKAEGDFTGIIAFINSPYSVIIILALIIINSGIAIWSSKNEMVKSGEALDDMAQNARLHSYYDASIYNATGVMDIKIYNQSPIIMEEVKKWDFDYIFLYP